jgi:hypothetical protein
VRTPGQAPEPEGGRRVERMREAQAWSGNSIQERSPREQSRDWTEGETEGPGKGRSRKAEAEDASLNQGTTAARESTDGKKLQVQA